MLAAARDLSAATGALVGVFLLAGLRRSEAAGLLVRDVDLAAGRLHVRPNLYRRLKTAAAERSVPLWPQLRELLSDHLDARGAVAPDALLFPSPQRVGCIPT